MIKHTHTSFILMFILLCTSSTVAIENKQLSSERFNHGLFWSISKDEKVAAYVLGTFHSNDKRVMQLPENVKKILSQAKSFSMESFPSIRYFNPHWGFRNILRDMTLPEGQTLKGLIGEQLYQRIVNILEKIEVKEERIANLYPWAVMNELGSRTFMNKKDNPGEIQDYFLFRMAKGKELYQVENLEELMAAYDDFPLAVQIDLLRDRVDAYEQLATVSEKMVRAYLEEDLDQILDLSVKFISKESKEKGHDKVYLKNVLYERNHVMAHHMLQPLYYGDAFISVGVLHLHGVQGVLSLLENYGYTVKPVKIKNN